MTLTEVPQSAAPVKEMVCLRSYEVTVAPILDGKPALDCIHDPETISMRYPLGKEPVDPYGREVRNELLYRVRRLEKKRGMKVNRRFFIVDWKLLHERQDFRR
jgi:hypothetical protein